VYAPAIEDIPTVVGTVSSHGIEIRGYGAEALARLPGVIGGE